MHETMLANLLTTLLQTPQPQSTHIIPHKITPTPTTIKNKMALHQHSFCITTVFKLNKQIIIKIKDTDRIDKQQKHFEEIWKCQKMQWLIEYDRTKTEKFVYENMLIRELS